MPAALTKIVPGFSQTFKFSAKIININRISQPELLHCFTSTAINAYHYFLTCSLGELSALSFACHFSLNDTNTKAT